MKFESGGAIHFGQIAFYDMEHARQVVSSPFFCSREEAMGWINDSLRNLADHAIDDVTILEKWISRYSRRSQSFGFGETK